MNLPEEGKGVLAQGIMNSTRIQKFVGNQIGLYTVSHNQSCLKKLLRSLCWISSTVAYSARNESEWARINQATWIWLGAMSAVLEVFLTSPKNSNTMGDLLWLPSPSSWNQRSVVADAKKPFAHVNHIINLF